MGKFNKGGKKGMPELNTSSLPDLIFTMLFFFMIVTTMREVTLKVQFKSPQATELEKLEKKSLVTFIYIGKPTQELQAKMGAETRIQLNDRFADVSEVQDYIYQERENMKEKINLLCRCLLRLIRILRWVSLQTLSRLFVSHTL